MQNNRLESGRSMVEILGTLAIIGVLSIAGIAGYKYGMDKYRANQTINDVMLMGVDMITQLSQNRGTPTLSSDWGTKTTAGYDFTVVQNPEDKTQYGIQITGVPSSICKMVGDGLKQTVAVYVGNEDYDSDTKEDPCDESDKNTMEFYFDKNTKINTETEIPNETRPPLLPPVEETEITDEATIIDSEITISPEETISISEEISEIISTWDGRCSSNSDCPPCQKCDYDYSSSYSYEKICQPDGYQNGDICGLPTGEIGPDGKPVYFLGGGACFNGECLTSCSSSTQCESGQQCLPIVAYSCSKISFICQDAPQTNTINLTYTDENGITQNETWTEVFSAGWYYNAVSACDAIGKTLPNITDFITDWDETEKQHTLNNRAKALFPLAQFHESAFWMQEGKELCNTWMISTSGYTGLSQETAYVGGILCKNK